VFQDLEAIVLHAEFIFFKEMHLDVEINKVFPSNLEHHNVSFILKPVNFS